MAISLKLQNKYFVIYFTAFFIMLIATLYFSIKIVIKDYLSDGRVE